MRVYLNKKEIGAIKAWKGVPPSLREKILDKTEGRPKETIIPEYDFFLKNKKKFLADKNLQSKFIAITGSNGKSTITSWLSNIYSTQAYGNIGQPLVKFQNHKYSLLYQLLPL